MSKKEIKIANTIIKVTICTAAVALGIVALFKNPCHLITAGAMFIGGLNCELVKKEDYDFI